MSSRRSVRQLLVAVLLGVLVGGGLMAVTPAGAEVSNAVATNWKKIWKKNLKPLADKRYYTKAQSDAKYSTKAETAAGDAASTAAANAATDSKLTGYYKKAEVDARSYTKAESDAKYAPYPALIRGAYAMQLATGVENDIPLQWGVTLASAPTVHFIATGGLIPAGCSGTAAAPNADPGHLCIFESGTTATITNRTTGNGTGTGASAPFGAYLLYTASATGWVRGTWAVRPPVAGVVAAPRGEAGAKPAPAKVGATSVD